MKLVDANAKALRLIDVEEFKRFSFVFHNYGLFLDHNFKSISHSMYCISERFLVPIKNNIHSNFIPLGCK